MPDEVSVSAKVVPALRWAWKNWDSIRNRLTQLNDWFRGTPSREDEDAKEPTRAILLVGPGGVGKTTFARLLCGDYHILSDDLGEYSESLSVETFEIQGDESVELVVLPGQRHRRADSWKALLEQIAEGRFRGIILFSSYGHHALGEIGYKSHRLFRDVRSKSRFVESFLEHQRRDEQLVLNEIAPYIATSGRRLWLLSLVTKQDLWWPKRQDIENHYRHGQFAARIEEITKQRTSSDFRHELAMGSLTIRNLVDGDGAILKKTAAGYDHAQQVESLRHIIEIVDSMREWEETQ